jgi:hypothetical protein
MEAGQPILLICLCLLGFVASISAIVTAGMEMLHAGLILAGLGVVMCPLCFFMVGKWIESKRTSTIHIGHPCRSDSHPVGSLSGCAPTQCHIKI